MSAGRAVRVKIRASEAERAEWHAKARSAGLTLTLPRGRRGGPHPRARHGLPEQRRQRHANGRSLDLPVGQFGRRYAGGNHDGAAFNIAWAGSRSRARYERRTRRRLRTPENPGRCSKRRSGTIARGEHTPAKGEPKVWFTLIESFAKLLSEHNRHRLELIAWERPGSLTELAELAGRSKSNLSRTLKTMSQCGPAESQPGSAARWCRGRRTTR